MAEGSSFTKAEVAAWHRERRSGARHGSDAGQAGSSGDTCTHCKQPLRADDFGAAEHGFCSSCIDRD